MPTLNKFKLFGFNLYIFQTSNKGQINCTFSSVAGSFESDGNSVVIFCDDIEFVSFYYIIQ